MSTDTLPALHRCDAACVVASETECGCGVLGPASQMCDECTAFFAAHPDGEVSL